MPRVKGSGATCSAFLEEPRCKGCLSKRPCHRKPANRRTDCTCGYCQSSIIQVAEDKEEGQLAQDSNHRCCRSQKKSNETQTPLFTTEKMLKYQTEAAKAEARKRKRREQAKYQNRKALKKREGTRPTFNSVFLFLFLNLFIWVVLVFIRIWLSSFHSNLSFVTILMDLSASLIFPTLTSCAFWRHHQHPGLFACDLYFQYSTQPPKHYLAVLVHRLVLHRLHRLHRLCQIQPVIIVWVQKVSRQQPD